MLEDLLQEYKERLENAINCNLSECLSVEEQLILVNSQCELLSELYKNVNLKEYYKSEYLHVANFWKDELSEHRKTKNKLKSVNLRYKDLYNKYRLLLDKKSVSNASNL